MTRPRSAFRRVERWMVGLVMGVVVFVLEKAVMRSLKKGEVRSRPIEPDAQTITSRGKEVDLDPGSG